MVIGSTTGSETAIREIAQQIHNADCRVPDCQYLRDIQARLRHYLAHATVAGWALVPVRTSTDHGVLTSVSAYQRWIEEARAARGTKWKDRFQTMARVAREWEALAIGQQTPHPTGQKADPT